MLPADSPTSFHPVEQAVARGRVLASEVIAGPVEHQYSRVRLVQTDVQPRPVRVMERWQMNANDRSLSCLSREMFLADQVIVRSPANLSASELARRLAESGLQVERVLGDRTLSIRLPKSDIQAVPNALKFFMAHPEMAESAEADGVGFGGGIPNDPRFAEQWGFHNTGQFGGTADADVDAPEFWNRAGNISGVVIAVLDSGLNLTHPDLQNIAASNPSEIAGDGIDNDSNGRVDDSNGWDFVNDDNNPTDDLGHGSNVTGIIAANRNNNQGVAGMVRGVRILVCKVLNASNSGTTSDLIAATAYARHRGAPIMNLSLQNYPFSALLDSEFSACESAGIVLSICAGNQGVDNDTTPNYPSSYSHSNIISVGNHDRTDRRWSGSFNPSNYGRTSVDLFAPGRDILSPILGVGYSSYTGTSQATPFVAAVCAALKYQHPSWKAPQIKQRLLAAAIRVASYRSICVTGARLNALRALDQPPDVEGPVIHIKSSKIAGNNRLTLTGTASDITGVAKVEYKALKKAFQKARGTSNWTASIPFPRTKRSIAVKLRATDLLGNRSKVISRKVARP